MLKTKEPINDLFLMKHKTHIVIADKELIDTLIKIDTLYFYATSRLKFLS